jgi:hypothetical protein
MVVWELLCSCQGMLLASDQIQKLIRACMWWQDPLFVEVSLSGHAWDFLMQLPIRTTCQHGSSFKSVRWSMCHTWASYQRGVEQVGSVAPISNSPGLPHSHVILQRSMHIVFILYSHFSDDNGLFLCFYSGHEEPWSMRSAFQVMVVGVPEMPIFF